MLQLEESVESHSFELLVDLLGGHYGAPREGERLHASVPMTSGSVEHRSAVGLLHGQLGLAPPPSVVGEQIESGDPDGSGPASLWPYFCARLINKIM